MCINMHDNLDYIEILEGLHSKYNMYDFEIHLIYDKEGSDFVVFYYNGCNRLRLFHSGLQDFESINNVIEVCGEALKRYNLIEE